jgi:DNA repair protein RadA/Sms
VLEKRAGLRISGQDIFMNVAGGVRIEEPAIDLGISTSLASSLLNRPVESDIVVFGEVGLAGEVRGVSQVELRLKEAEKLGFKKCVLPRINLERLKHSDSNVSLIGIDSIEKAIEVLF